MLLPIFGPSSLPVVVARLDKRNANRTASVLEWHDRHSRAYNNWLKLRSSYTGERGGMPKNLQEQANFFNLNQPTIQPKDRIIKAYLS